MATEVIFDTAQDEVCVELWDVLQAVKARTLVYLSDSPHDEGFSREVADMLFLMDRSGDIYRRHAEDGPSLWARMRAERANFLDFLKENNEGGELPVISESGTPEQLFNELASLGAVVVMADEKNPNDTNG